MCVRPRPVVVYRRITELMSSIFTLAKRLSVAALTSIAIAGAVVAPAEAAPITNGCRAATQPAIVLGKAGHLQVEIPAAPGWHDIGLPKDARATDLGQLRDAAGQDRLNASAGVLKPSITTSAQLADASLAGVQILSRRTVKGPCGLPTEAVTFQVAGGANQPPLYRIAWYTAMRYNSTTAGVDVSVGSYDRNRLPQLENELLRGYGLI